MILNHDKQQVAKSRLYPNLRPWPKAHGKVLRVRKSSNKIFINHNM